MYFLRSQLILIFIWTFFFKPTKTYNYCGKEQEQKLCGGREHLICSPDTVPQGGQLIALAPMTRKLKRIFVEIHNENRNKLAGGGQEFKNGGKFPKATRMREMLWDDELAYLAAEHARHCKVQRDNCRSTERFKGAGQNLFAINLFEDIINITEAIYVAVNGWWSEALVVEDGNRLADKFPDGVTNWRAVVHFTAMANDGNSFLGCAVAKCKNCDQGDYCAEITCNYAPTNIEGAPMYKKGNTPASECGDFESTPSESYKHLCKNTGKLMHGFCTVPSL